MGSMNSKGRSTGQFSAKEKKLFGPAKGESWQWISTELMCSPSWRAMSINCHKLIDFLIVEHRSHAGRENGNLMATYDQLVEYGLSRSEIRFAIDEAVFLGLINHDPGGRWEEKNSPSTFELNFYAHRDRIPANHRWKGKTQDAIDEWKKDRVKKRKPRKKQNDRFNSRTTVVRLSELRRGF